MQITTTKQLMDQSKPFKALFWGSIVCILVGAILCIIFPFTSCSSYSYNYYSCYDYYYYYIYECYSGSTYYCCQSGYSYCGSSYCVTKPLYPWYRPCAGVMITGSSLIGLGGLLAIFVFVMFCNFRSKIKRGVYNHMVCPQYQGLNQPLYGNPVIVYSDQQVQPQFHAGNQINQS